MSTTLGSKSILKSEIVLGGVAGKCGAYAYVATTALGAALCVHSSAVMWETETFQQRLRISVILFMLTAVITFAFRYLRPISASRIPVMCCAALSIITADIVYSDARGEVILLVLPTLFCVPGCLLGLFAADLIKTTARLPAPLRGFNLPREQAETVV